MKLLVVYCVTFIIVVGFQASPVNGMYENPFVVNGYCVIRIY